MRYTLFLSLLPLAACDGKSPFSGDPQTSYCEALCDWATTCAEAEREIDPSLEETCVSETEASDPSCAEAAEGLNAADSAVLTECTDAIEDARDAGECGAFTGSIDEIKAGTPPAECAGQGTDAQDTFDRSRESTQEGADELCERFTTTFCDKVQECLVGELGDSAEQVWKSLGSTAAELCLATDSIASFQTSCQEDDLYAPEESIDDVNTARQGARECLSGFTALTCEEIFSGTVPPTCAASFSSTEQATAFASGLLDVAETVRAEAESQ